MQAAGRSADLRRAQRCKIAAGHRCKTQISQEPVDDRHGHTTGRRDFDPDRPSRTRIIYDQARCRLRRAVALVARPPRQINSTLQLPFPADMSLQGTVPSSQDSPMGYAVTMTKSLISRSGSTITSQRRRRCRVDAISVMQRPENYSTAEPGTTKCRLFPFQYPASDSVLHYMLRARPPL